jgi:hypothetical protein
VDEYEELLSILDELSYRELSILSTLAHFERTTNFVRTGNDRDVPEKVWPKGGRGRLTALYYRLEKLVGQIEPAA